VEQSPYCIALALVNAAKGKLENGFAFCGANAFRVKKIVSVKDLVNELMTEAEIHFKGFALKPAV
jgi:nitronate monooxygenase